MPPGAPPRSSSAAVPASGAAALRHGRHSHHKRSSSFGDLPGLAELVEERGSLPPDWRAWAASRASPPGTLGLAEGTLQLEQEHTSAPGIPSTATITSPAAMATATSPAAAPAAGKGGSRTRGMQDA